MQEFDRETMGAQAPRQYEIAVESMDEVLRLFGVFDENLSIIQQETGANIKTDGGSISITGEAEAAALAHEVVDRLLTILRRGENIDRSRIRYAVDLAKEGNGELILELLDDVVAFTNKGRRIKCKTLGQKKYVSALKRHTVVSGEKLGFLPGDLQNKVDPYLRPLYDALYDFLGSENFHQLVERGAIEVAPLAYMRGRTLNNAYIILDEAQNCTCEQMKMFLTRFGEGSRVVVTGDITQIDLPREKKSGLVHALEVLRDVEGISQVYLTHKDVVRHEMVQRIIRAYDRAEAGRNRGQDEG